MPVVTFEGVVENGRVRLPPDVVLPEQQTVFVVVPLADPPAVPKLPSARLVRPEDAAAFELKVCWETPGGRPVTPYDGQLYQPPAPVAALTLRTLDGREQTLAGVPAVLDTGADVTLVPRWAVEQLGLTPHPDAGVALAGFDGTVHTADVVELEASWLGGRFQGRYAVVDQPHGVVGRNLLNHFRLLFDGPARTWQRVPTG
ncbi:MAG: aspartyl protease family protein [Gemmataceae bacterium]